MRSTWTSLSEQDQMVFRVVGAFLSGRLEERGTLDWALKLARSDTAKRMALLELVESPEGRKAREPWRTAWHWVEEAWSYPLVIDTSIQVYHVKQRLRSGDRSGALIAELVGLVEPRLSVEALSRSAFEPREVPRRPKRVRDLLWARLISGEILDLSVLDLAEVGEVQFLVALAGALERAVSHGLDIARRIGWDGKQRMLEMGQLHRVYYVPATGHAAGQAVGEFDPDRFHRGIAPSVKLLHAVVTRLAEVDVAASLDFAQRWRLMKCPIHQRLWAALARDPRISTSTEVGTFLLALDARPFWNSDYFPEIAELRARRFGEFEPDAQIAITARIRRLPPRNQWSRQTDVQRLNRARIRLAARELRRIELAGTVLRPADDAWLDSMIAQFPDLAQMNQVDEGFIAAKGTPESSEPGDRYAELTGIARLNALEISLTAQASLAGIPFQSAAGAWMQPLPNLLHVLSDLESDPNSGAAYPSVWQKFTATHALSLQSGVDLEQRQLSTESSRVLALLQNVPLDTMARAIDGIAGWLSAWDREVVKLPDYQAVWQRLWPLAVAATNAQQGATEAVDLNSIAPAADDREPMDLDTLNTPAGELVGVFLRACFQIEPAAQPFQTDSKLLEMRDTLIDAPGRTALIVRHRLIEHLPYFLAADPQWTQERLIAPLKSQSADALALWRAIARQTQFFDVLSILGAEVAERVISRDLGRESRQSLVFSLMVECLWALQEQRDPAVPYSRIQQTLRRLDDEVRAYAAESIRRFVSDVPATSQGRGRSLTPESVFHGSAVPLLEQVWPHERSLATSGVSKALARLPAASGEAFAEAVNTIERFLVPFDCWSMLDYGLYGEEGGEVRLAKIDNHDKAAALLFLLDRTVGTSESAVVPHDLTAALDQVQKVSTQLASSGVFRRLATAARRA